MTDQTRPMDTKRIAEIRARVEAATPGPWERGFVGVSFWLDSVFSEPGVMLDEPEFL